MNKTYSDFEKEFLKSKFRNEPYLRDAYIKNALRTQLEKKWIEPDLTKGETIATFKTLDKK
jgi:hypothetical protein